MSTDNKTKIAILTGNYRIVGYVDLIQDVRLTDFLAETKEFIALSDAEVWNLDGRRLFASSFMSIQRNVVEIIMPFNLITHGLGVAGVVPNEMSVASSL